MLWEVCESVGCLFFFFMSGLTKRPNQNGFTLVWWFHSHFALSFSLCAHWFLVLGCLCAIGVTLPALKMTFGLFSSFNKVLICLFRNHKQEHSVQSSQYCQHYWHPHHQIYQQCVWRICNALPPKLHGSHRKLPSKDNPEQLCGEFERGYISGSAVKRPVFISGPKCGPKQREHCSSVLFSCVLCIISSDTSSFYSCLGEPQCPGSSSIGPPWPQSCQSVTGVTQEPSRESWTCRVSTATGSGYAHRDAVTGEGVSEADR